MGHSNRGHRFRKRKRWPFSNGERNGGEIHSSLSLLINLPQEDMLRWCESRRTHSPRAVKNKSGDRCFSKTRICRTLRTFQKTEYRFGLAVNAIFMYIYTHGSCLVSCTIFLPDAYEKGRTNLQNTTVRIWKIPSFFRYKKMILRKTDVGWSKWSGVWGFSLEALPTRRKQNCSCIHHFVCCLCVISFVFIVESLACLPFRYFAALKSKCSAVHCLHILILLCIL